MKFTNPVVNVLLAIVLFCAMGVFFMFSYDAAQSFAGSTSPFVTLPVSLVFVTCGVVMGLGAGTLLTLVISDKIHKFLVDMDDKRYSYLLDGKTIKTTQPVVSPITIRTDHLLPESTDVYFVTSYQGTSMLTLLNAFDRFSLVGSVPVFVTGNEKRE